ncbi:phosphoglycolate phosphatase-like HAD superfamily hydrolase [Rhizobium leguminosarum]|uniref:SIR2 family protein n=1 Tax=Rhizobium leguminosarum TaxID=384 RepID=UPI00161F01FD|nr:SIR2 family protein [Rhizobium leguminosarum]MBB4587934.1 phosphoglycolate phosphatase-like HAD superfamily hydrolase [Rhizobium leguminosarum]
MTILSGDLLTQLSFSVYGNKGVYALLVGSGLSRSASIPTGWEITIDLVRRVATAQGVPEQADWSAWYRTQFGMEPSYSELVEQLGRSPDERRSILHAYIEPDEADREEGRKLPTKAHHAIARLVKDGYIKVIVTTNFDRLLENALREAGVEPTVVASVDALLGAEPLVHSSAYLLKLHGDYKDARILNTEAELSGYPEQYNALLDRIIDEYGLIVCGWSGEWDHALRAAMLRAPSRRYPMFWAARGTVGTGASQLIQQRRAQTIEISDADVFFEGIEERVQTLARTHRQQPLGIELLVNTVKRYLGKTEFRIPLDDLIASEFRSFQQRLEAEALMSQGTWSVEEFKRRISLYESLSEPLVRVAAVIGRWGGQAEHRIILDIVKFLSSNTDRELGGLLPWLHTRSYPAVLITASYGLGLVRARRWKDLHEFMSAQIQRPNEPSPERIIDFLFLAAWDGASNDYWRNFEGPEGRKTAFSDYLCALLGTWTEPMVGTVPNFELLFETWEILGVTLPR